MRNRKKEDLRVSADYGPIAFIVIAMIYVVASAFALGSVALSAANMDKRIYQLELEIQKHQEVLSSIGKRLQ
jgi:hypothetical protein